MTGGPWWVGAVMIRKRARLSFVIMTRSRTGLNMRQDDCDLPPGPDLVSPVLCVGLRPPGAQDWPRHQAQEARQGFCPRGQVWGQVQG